MLKALKERAARQAAKLADSEAVQKAVVWAIDKGSKVKAGVAEARKSLARQLTGAGEDDLQALKKKLDPHVWEGHRGPVGGSNNGNNGKG